ncbi:putative ankyrin repeat protein RF_0381 [Microplitis mediator]|uniref:putative ankyrin repeat protein RF_0381 n=1 Tax=Microplitis mediator TaxID=375433 RepID=UPI002556B948|nr:putative ankyrin repeat protein RF_0381 [Microplitis mediator]XP_057333538.1 putative ankyrin repeat protein RF_0381 [Microplitis mediator]XP_057333539.1 putative ankyrin repeat protein RF_0381 [Microplitis mediator]XP_057333540.1 putative ankyrin repeat protein RF_0381 [Microplitis mediator]
MSAKEPPPKKSKSFVNDEKTQKNVSPSTVNSPSPGTSASSSKELIEKSIKLVDQLLKKGVDVNFATETKEPALHSAISANNLPLVEKLISAGADVNMMSLAKGPFYDLTPLQVAVENENVKIVELLIKNNAHVNIDSKRSTVLTKAARKGNFELVDLLIKAGAHVNPDSEQAKPLHMAIAKNNYEMTECLIARGADVNSISKNRTSLQTAVKRGNKPIVELLLRHSADVNDCLNGKSVLCIAVENNNFELAELLLNAGACINPISFYGVPLHWAILENNYGMVEYLITRGADVNGIGFVDKYPYQLHGNFSPLQLAVRVNNLNIINLLLNNNADINLVVNNDEFFDDSITALHFAVEFDYSEAAKLLLNNNTIDLEVVTAINQESVLHYAARYSKDDSMVNALLEAGADVNHLNGFGNAAISCSATLDVRNSMEQHIVKLVAAGFAVGEKNLQEVEEEQIENLYEKCCNEIEMMRKVKIFETNYSFYEILKKSRHEIALFLINVSDDNFFNEDDLRLRFPLYGGIIYNRLKKGIDRRNFLLKVLHLLYDILSEQLPELILRKVTQYLTNQDLKISSE